MHKLDFLRLRAVGKWLPVGEGDQICDTKSARESLFILVQGRIHATYRYEDHADLTMQAFEKVYCSGDVFDYRAFNAFGVFVGCFWLGLELTSSSAVHARSYPQLLSVPSCYSSVLNTVSAAFAFPSFPHLQVPKRVL